MDLTPFTQVLADMREHDGRYRVTLPQDWLQGRTAYGGLMAALGFEAAMRAVPDLPPVRSAQIAFIGPSGDAVDVAVKVLRQGRSVAFVECDLSSAKGLATRCLFCFGAGRPSGLDAPVLTPPRLEPPEDLPEYIGVQGAPAFTRHYETRLVDGGLPGSGSPEPEILVWVRHKDAEARGATAGLLALADMLPPAMLPTLSHLVPVSSMTWHIDFLVTEPPADEGWRLSLAKAESAAEGYSSQRMVTWDRQGVPLLVSRQSIAIFDR